MKRPQQYLTSAALIMTAAFAGSILTATVFNAGGANGAPQQGLAAPAEDAPAPAAAPEADPCSLITQAEAAAALGTEVTQLASPGQCTYVGTDSTARGLAVAMPDFSANRNELKAGAEQTASALDGTSRSISAGDEAYAVLSPMVSQALGVQGGTLVVIALTNPSGTADEQSTRLDDLLGSAFGRL